MGKKGKTNWRGAWPRFTAGEALRAAAVAAALLLVAWFSTTLLSGKQADAAALPVVIRRVMTSNPSVCFKVDGEYYDWIELYNTDDAAVDLTGWKLTDTGDLRDAFVFGGVSIDAGDTLVVYCDEKPEDYTGDAVFTGFRLSSDGELLLLADPSQRAAGVKVPALRKGFVCLRDMETGEYSAEPYGELSDAEKAERARAEGFNPGEVMISEVMPLARSILPDEDGDFSDWIELYNPRSEPVNLDGWALTDDLKRAKWLFPERVMQPGEYLVVFCSGKNRRAPGGSLHTNFRLSGKGETVRLSNAEGEVVSQITFGKLNADQTLARDPSGALTDVLPATPGAANVDPGPTGDLARLYQNRLGLYINEIYHGGRGSDWVEIKNTGDQPVDLSGMGVSDNPDKPRRWRFPDGATLAPGGVTLIELAGNAETQAARQARGTGGIRLPAPKAEDGAEAAAPRQARPDYTADFGLTAGETLCLSTAEGKLIDRVMLPEGFRDASMGRADGYDSFRWFGDMTPGAQNAAQSYARVRREVTLSPASGLIREKPVYVTLTAEPGVSIYYTTDGSTPTAKSKVYTGPIELKSNVIIMAAADPTDVMEPTVTRGTYIFGEHTLPLITVTGREKDLTRSDSMMFTGEKGRGADVFAEIYDADGQRLVGQFCHMTMVGHTSRVQNSQKAFKLNARRANGDTRFRAKLFTKREYEAYKAVVLRASGQDYKKSHMLDSILTSLAEGTHVPYQETEPCVLYLNGQYWGVYNLREHIDAHSLCQWEGWSDPDSVTIIKGSGTRSGAAAGSSSEYKRFWDWQKATDFTVEANLEALRQRLDVENYLDYAALEMYTNNQDLNNVRCYRSETEDPRWKHVIFDLDISFYDREKGPANVVKSWLSGTAGVVTPQDTSLFRGLMKNREVREYFLTRMGELLATNLSAKTVTGRIMARYELIKDEMVRNCKRWKWEYKDWESAVKRILKYAEARPGRLIKNLQDAFDLTDAEVQKYFGEALLADQNG